jgi:hypothetical protein
LADTGTSLTVPAGIEHDDAPEFTWHVSPVSVTHEQVSGAVKPQGSLSVHDTAAVPFAKNVSRVPEPRAQNESV